MSEFTDFYALLTEAQTLADLRGAIERSVSGAYVPLSEVLDALGDDALDDPDALPAAWAKAPKPMWIKLGLPWSEDRDELDGLATLGPALRLRGEEDFSSWGVDMRCGGHRHQGAVLLGADIYREATDGMPVFSEALDTAPIAACLGVENSALRATMIPDGGESFATVLGFAYEQMLDMTLEDPEVGEYTFGYGF